MTSRYDEIDSKALEILMDYSDAFFPINLKKNCERLRIKLIPYSSLSEHQYKKINELALNGELKDGCSIILDHPDENGYLAYTYYNDCIADVYVDKRINYTIAHEIKHVVYKEVNPTDIEEKEAEHFARMLLAPTCILIVGKYDDYRDVEKNLP